METIRVFPRRTSHTPTDDMAFVGNPPMFRPDADEVHVSVAFTWDIPEGQRLAGAWANYYPAVRIGGPALDSCPNGFQPGQYVKKGVTFTSRGCNNRCPWCLVPTREGRLREYAEIPAGHIINDNNFLQCSPEHRQRVYRMLAEQRDRATFSGGIQASLVSEDVAAEFRDIRIEDVFLAADTDRALRPLERAIARLQFLGRERTRCYTMIGFGGESIEQAERRLKAVWELGAMPHAQLYQPADRYIKYGSDWRALARTWSRPAAMKAEMRMALVA